MYTILAVTYKTGMHQIHRPHQYHRTVLVYMQDAADQAAAAARHEEDFWVLLEMQDPPLTSKSSWPALRRQVCQMHLVTRIHSASPPCGPLCHILLVVNGPLQLTELHL